MACPHVALLHTTCCYFRDGLHLNAELDNPLTVAGARVTHILTGGGICTYSHQLPEPKVLHCAARWEHSRAYLAGTKDEVLLLEDYVRRVSGSADAESCPLNAHASLASIEFDGYCVWELVKGSVAKYLHLSALPDRLADLDERAQAVAAEFFRSAVHYLRALPLLFRETAPTHLLLFNGMFYLERIAFEVASRAGVSCIATESSAFRDRKYFDPSGVVGNRHSFGASALHRLDARRLTSKERERLRVFLSDIYAGRNNWISQAPPSVAVREALDIPVRARIVTFFAQVPGDSVLTYDSPVYADQRDAIADVRALVAGRRDVYLVIRVHPGRETSREVCRGLADELRASDLPPNVRVVAGQELNTHALMRETTLGITICSQAGLELLSMHRPVLVLGSAFYARLGFTHDVVHRDALPDTLERALDAPTLSEEQVELIDTFLYALIFEHLVPVDREKGFVHPSAVPRVVDLLTR